MEESREENGSKINTNSDYLTMDCMESSLLDKLRLYENDIINRTLSHPQQTGYCANTTKQDWFI